MSLLINVETANRILSPEHRKEEMAIAQRQLLDSAKLNNQQLMQLWALVGECYKFDKKAQYSEYAYLKAIETIENSGDEKLLGEGYKSLGDALYFCGDYVRATTYYEQAVGIFERLDEIAQMVSTLSQMAYAYAEIGRRGKEIHTLTVATRQPSIQPLIKATLLERIALSLSKSGKIKDAIKTYEQSLSIFESVNFKREWRQRIQNLAQLYRTVGDEVGVQKTLERYTAQGQKFDF